MGIYDKQKGLIYKKKTFRDNIEFCHILVVTSGVFTGGRGFGG